VSWPTTAYATSQEHNLPGRSDSPALLRQAPHTWNISPTYDRGRLSLRLGLAYNGANIFSYFFQDGAPGGIHGPAGDLYLYPHLQVDAQGSFYLGKGFTAIAQGLNLNDEVFGLYFGSEPYIGHSGSTTSRLTPSACVGIGTTSAHENCASSTCGSRRTV